MKMTRARDARVNIYLLMTALLVILTGCAPQLIGGSDKSGSTANGLVLLPIDLGDGNPAGDPAGTPTLAQPTVRMNDLAAAVTASLCASGAISVSSPEASSNFSALLQLELSTNNGTFFSDGDCNHAINHVVLIPGESITLSFRAPDPGTSTWTLTPELGSGLARVQVQLSINRAPAGTLDPGFGAEGKITPLINPSSMAFQADGKIVVAGACVGSLSCVGRYKIDGTPDTTFGDVVVGSQPVRYTGIKIIPGGSANGVNSIKILTDQSILLGSTLWSDATGYDIGLVKLTQSGDYDKSFGEVSGNQRSGRIQVDTGTNFAFDTAVDSHGRIVIVGGNNDYSDPANGYVDPNYCGMQMARLTSAGDLDPSFNAGNPNNNSGIICINREGHLASLVIDDSDKIIIAGNQDTGTGTTKIYLGRLNENGSKDQNFGTSGETSLTLGGSNSAAIKVALQASKIIVLGSTNFWGGILARFDSTGTLDQTFGADQNGTISLDSKVSRVLVDPTSKEIYVAVRNWSTEMAINRFTSDGLYDPGFGNNGFASVDYPDSIIQYQGTSTTALTMDSHRRIVVGGYYVYGIIDGMLAGRSSVFRLW